LIRHVRLDSDASPVLPLPVAMVLSAFRALLMTTVGEAPLQPTRLVAAL